ncbi:MAG: SdrD B-like domain-containing protein, partial [bacterium]
MKAIQIIKTCIAAVLLAIILLTTAGVKAWTAQNPVDLRQVEISTDQVLRASRDGCTTVYYYDDTCTNSYAWPMPQDSTDWFAVRFTNEVSEACTLGVVRVKLYRPFMVGTPDLQIGVYDDDGFGLPSTLLATETVSYASLPTENFGWAEADFSPHGFIAGTGSEFHIGITTIGEEGDTLFVLSDAGTGPHAGEDRSETRSPSDGSWYTLNSFYGIDYVFMIEADMYCAVYASISGTKFNDENGNSVWDVGENPLDNVDIKLHGVLDAGGTLDQTTKTDLAGNYMFYNLPPGDYSIQEVVQSWWNAQTYPLTVMHTIDNLQYTDHLTGYDFGNDTLCEGTITSVTCLHGTDDNFNGPEPSYMSTGLHDYIINNSPGGMIVEDFDQPADNQWFGHTFNDCWDDECVVIDATLTVKVKASASGSTTDYLVLGDYSSGTYGRIWSMKLSDLELLMGGDGIWNVGDVMTIVLDLENLPPNAWLPTNILAALQDGDLDIMITDDSYVDYIKMDVDLCCKCTATGDINDDGMPLTIGDISILIDHLFLCGQAPVELYEADLNGDCIIDSMDIIVWQDYMTYGYSVFDQYGGYPVPTCCDPEVVTVPDTVNIFGLEHISLGTACFSDNGEVLNVSRIAIDETEIHVSADNDTIIVQYIPAEKAAGSGGGPYNTSMSNLEDAGIAWQVGFEEDTTLESGASIQTFNYVKINEDSMVVECSAVQTKQESGGWALGVNSFASSYNVEAYLDGELIWSQTSIPAISDWFQIGFCGPIIAHEGKAAGSGGGPYNTSMSNLEDAGIVAIDWGVEDTSIVWNWASQGVTDLIVDKIQVSFNRIGERMTVASIGAYNIPEYTIVSESQTVDYKGVGVSNLGNAIMNCVDTTLVVSNLGPSGDDGIAPWLRGDAKSIVEIIMDNPNLGGEFPVGGSIRVGYEFASSVDDTYFPAESFFDFAGSNTWNLGVLSDTDSYTVVAYNDEESVFEVSGVDASSLGYIIETTKGVYPVGFSGSTNGKPSTIVATTTDYDFTAFPDGVQWSWSAQSVSDLTIDYLCVAPKVDDYDDGVHSMTLCGQDGSKAGPISVTILDIRTSYGGCCIGMRGNANGDPGDNVLVDDLVYLVNYIFKSGVAPICLEEGDVTGDGSILVNDLVLLVNYIFKSGPAPLNCGEVASIRAGKLLNNNITLLAEYNDGKTTVTLESPIDLNGIQIDMTGETNSNPMSSLAGLDLFFHQTGTSYRVGMLDM